VEADDVGEECLRHGLGSVRVAKRDEVGVLAEAVDDGEDDRLAVDPWQCLDEVQPNVGLDTGRYRQGQQEARWKQVLRLIALARGACPHEVLHNAAHVGEVEVAVQSVPRALHTFMPIVMDRSDNLLE
jgi:hypothetical protein